MKKNDGLVITFHETMMALFMEKNCQSDGKAGRLIPLPKVISAGCGLAWSTKDKNQKQWIIYMNERGIVYEQMVEVNWE